MTKNRQTALLKAAIMRTFNEMQEDGAPHSLLVWARANPKDFYTGLLPRLLPKPVEITTDEGVSFAIVYQMDGRQVVIGQDGKPRLPDPDVVDVECEQTTCSVGRRSDHPSDCND